MLHNTSPNELFLVVDVSDILNEYHLHPLITSLFPKLTIQGFIAITMAINATPSRNSQLACILESTLGEETFNEIDLATLELVNEDIALTIDRKVAESIQPAIHSEPAFFRKWLNHHTLVLAYHNDPQINRQLQESAIIRLYSYLSSPNPY